MEAINVGQLTHHVLTDMNERVAKAFDADCVFINSDMRSPLDDEFRVVIEELTGGEQKQKLAVILQTAGGYMETVERLVAVMRKGYKEISYVIPNYAYSAGTVLVMSGDEIYMDYYSVLGPIDPQYPGEDGRFLPGMGYLAKFEELRDLINKNGAGAHQAEMAYLVKNFDPAQLFHIEQAITHGESLIKEWLPKYKFKDWKKTQTSGKKVTKQMKIDRAEKIAKVLGNAEKWHSHGRGISMRELKTEEINLIVKDFGQNPSLSMDIRNYHGLAVDYYQKKSGVNGFIHSRLGMRSVL